MSASSFIASLVGSLAWPAVIIAILVIFHRQFGTMLERLARVRLGAGAGGSEADLDWNQTESVIRQSLASARPDGLAGSSAAAAGADSAPGAGPGGRGSGPAGTGTAGGRLPRAAQAPPAWPGRRRRWSRIAGRRWPASCAAWSGRRAR